MSMMPRLVASSTYQSPQRRHSLLVWVPLGLRMAERCSLARMWLQCPHLPLQLDGAGWEEKEGRD